MRRRGDRHATTRSAAVHDSAPTTKRAHKLHNKDLNTLKLTWQPQRAGDISRNEWAWCSGQECNRGAPHSLTCGRVGIACGTAAAGRPRGRRCPYVGEQRNVRPTRRREGSSLADFVPDRLTEFRCFNSEVVTGTGHSCRIKPTPNRRVFGGGPSPCDAGKMRTLFVAAAAAAVHSAGAACPSIPMAAGCSVDASCTTVSCTVDYYGNSFKTQFRFHVW